MTLSAAERAAIRQRADRAREPLHPYSVQRQIGLLIDTAGDVPALLDALEEAERELARLRPVIQAVREYRALWRSQDGRTHTTADVWPAHHRLFQAIDGLGAQAAEGA